MSIYSTWLHLNEHDNHQENCQRYVATSPKEAQENGSYAVFNSSPDTYHLYDKTRTCTCGERGPLVYQGSHVNPDTDGLRGGYLEVGAIPNHCHPSARGTSDEGEAVEFLRMSMDEDKDTYHGGIPGSATVVLERSQVEALRDTLTQWLASHERY